MIMLVTNYKLLRNDNLRIEWRDTIWIMDFIFLANPWEFYIVYIKNESSLLLIYLLSYLKRPLSFLDQLAQCKWHMTKQYAKVHNRDVCLMWPYFKTHVKGILLTEDKLFLCHNVLFHVCNMFSLAEKTCMELFNKLRRSRPVVLWVLTPLGQMTHLQR